MKAATESGRRKRRILLWAAACVLAAALFAVLAFLPRQRERVDESMKAALEPVFKREGIQSNFEVTRRKNLFSERIIVKFAPGEAQKPSHGKKEALLIPLVAAGYAVSVAAPGIDEVEIQTVNSDENAVRLRAGVSTIKDFIANSIGIEKLEDAAQFSVEQWQPKSSDAAAKSRELLERGRMFANEKGNLQKALPFFKEAYALNPNDFDILFALGVTAPSPDNVRFLEAARDLKPAEYRIYPALARSYAANKQNGPALDALKQFADIRRSALAADPFLAPALYQAAATCFDLRYYADAEILARELLASSPNHAHGWMLLGQTQYNLKKKKDALASFQKSAGLEPRDPILLLQLGWYLCDLKDFRLATLAYRQSYTLGNRDAALFMGLSHAYNSTGNYFDAKNVLVEGFRHHLNDPELERNFRAVQWVITKKRLRPKGPPEPIALSEG